MAPKAIAVGRYARDTTSCRIDAIGKVVRSENGYTTIRVPNWQADGWYLDFSGRNDEFERSTASACTAAAKRR